MGNFNGTHLLVRQWSCLDRLSCRHYRLLLDKQSFQKIEHTLPLSQSMWLILHPTAETHTKFDPSNQYK